MSEKIKRVDIVNGTKKNQPAGQSEEDMNVRGSKWNKKVEEERAELKESLQLRREILAYQAEVDQKSEEILSELHRREVIFDKTEELLLKTKGIEVENPKPEFTQKERTRSAVMETERRGGLHSIRSIVRHLLGKQ